MIKHQSGLECDLLQFQHVDGTGTIDGAFRKEGTMTLSYATGHQIFTLALTP
jgi:hypothetical protein